MQIERRQVPRADPQDDEGTIRRIDAVMRWGVLQLASCLPARPSDAYHDIAAGKTHPWCLLMRRCREAAVQGVPRSFADALIDAFRQMVDLVWGRWGWARHLRLIKPEPRKQLPERTNAE